MKLLRAAVLFLITLSFLGVGAVALAATENWVTDPANGSQICIMFWDNSSHLVSASWSGPAVNGEAEGKGILNFVYTGKDGKEIKVQADAEMKVGKLDGKASVKWSNGQSYDGYYKEGFFSGRGGFKSNDGTVVEGEWASGSLNGKGSMRLPDGRSYEGDFAHGVPDGKVFYKMADGRTYEGDMVKGIFQGKGVMKFPNGNAYDGDWANGQPNGKGTLHMANGVTYEGDFVSGKRTGKGVQSFPDGTRYEGDFLNDMFHGNGILYGPDGKILKQGEWQNDQLVDVSKPIPDGGKPVATGSNPTAATESWATDPNTGCRIDWVSEEFTLVAASWTGTVIDGKADGQGTLSVTIRNKAGNITKGNSEAEMKVGKLDGKVSIKWSDGESYDGYYKEGQREGKGIQKLADGISYDGEWKDGKKNGQGVLKDPAGIVVYDGEWKDDHLAGPPKTDKVLGVPWGASEDEANKIMLARPGTSSKGVVDFKTYKQYVYLGPYNDEQARILVGFYQGKMFTVVAELFSAEDGVMAKFDTVRQGLTRRYGQPFKQEGKSLDSKLFWEIGGGYSVAVAIQNEAEFTAKANVAEWLHRPLGVIIGYAYADTWNMLVKTEVKQSGKDY